MIKKRYVKRMYVEEAFCDECGSPMKFTGVVLTTWPEQYPYNCVNPNCNGHKIFYGDDWIICLPISTAQVNYIMYIDIKNKVK